MALNVGTLYQELELDDRKWRSGLATVSREAQSAGSRAGNAFGDGIEKGIDSGVRGATRDLDRLEREAGKSAGKVKGKFSNAMSGMGGALAGLGVGLFLKQSTQAASDLSESLSKSNVVFGDSAKAIEEWSKTSAQNFGMSQQAALEATGTYGNLMVSLGLSESKSKKMSTSLVELAGDLASFNNTSTEEALQALRSGLVGETEPLKRFGVNMNETTLKAKALKMGLIESTTQALDPQTKSLAAYALIMEQTKTAQGDFKRTSDGMANSQRTANAEFEDAKAALGTDLVPLMTKAFKAGAGLARAFSDLPGPLQNATIGLAAFVLLAPRLAAIKSMAGGLPGRFTRTTTAINGSTAALEGQSAAAATAKGKWAALGKSIGVAALAWTAFQGAQAIGDSGDVGKWAAANGSGGSWWSDALNESSIGAQNLVDRVTGVELPGLKASREAYNAQEAARLQQQKSNEIAQWKIAHPKQARKMMRKSRRAGNPATGEGKNYNVQNMNVYASNPDQLAKQMRRKAKHNALRGGN